MYLSLCPLLMPARKYATFILWPQSVQAYVCVCVRVKSVSTATPTGSMLHLFTLLFPFPSVYLSTSCMLCCGACCCMLHALTFLPRWHFTFYSNFSASTPLPLSLFWLKLCHDLILHNLLAQCYARLLAPPPNCIFSNAIGYLEYLNAVISCRKLRLDLCACTPYGGTPSRHTSCRCSCARSCNYLLPTFARSSKVERACL